MCRNRMLQVYSVVQRAPVDFQVPMVWNKELDQGHTDNGRNSLLREKAFPRPEVGQSWREVKGSMALSLQAS